MQPGGCSSEPVLKAVAFILHENGIGNESRWASENLLEMPKGAEELSNGGKC